jgi:Phage integrase family.
MDAELVKALRALRAHQAAERLAAGSAYADSGRVVVDELGGPIWPEWYSDEFGRVIRAAGVRRITLHDSRHTTLTLMEHAGVPISIISRWAGHYDPSFTYSKYVHAADEDLKTGTEAIAGLYN